jgi:hypothetical protein
MVEAPGLPTRVQLAEGKSVSPNRAARLHRALPCWVTNDLFAVTCFDQVFFAAVLVDTTQGYKALSGILA